MMVNGMMHHIESRRRATTETHGDWDLAADITGILVCMVMIHCTIVRKLCSAVIHIAITAIS